MTRRPIATIRVLHRPDLAEGCIRIEIECSGSVTGLTHVPGPVDLPTPALITAACFEHESRCGSCDTSEAHARGAEDLREETERVYEAIQQRRIRYYAHGRRN
jgi:hypothetical protein